MFRGFLSSSRIGRTPSQSQPTSGWRCCVAHRRLALLPLQPSPPDAPPDSLGAPCPGVVPKLQQPSYRTWLQHHQKLSEPIDKLHATPAKSATRIPAPGAPRTRASRRQYWTELVLRCRQSVSQCLSPSQDQRFESVERAGSSHQNAIGLPSVSRAHEKTILRFLDFAQKRTLPSHT
jgi:hypothetical protein